MTLTGMDNAPTRNKQILEWVEEMAELAQPDRIEWCDGSQEEWNRLTSELVDAGTGRVAVVSTVGGQRA